MEKSLIYNIIVVLKFLNYFDDSKVFEIWQLDMSISVTFEE